MDTENLKDVQFHKKRDLFEKKSPVHTIVIVCFNKNNT